METGTICIIDLSHLIMIRYAVEPATCVATVRSWLSDLDREYHGRVLIALDSPPYKRSELFEGYKANRKEKEPELVEAIEQIRKHCYRAFDGRTFAVPGAEADDVICCLVGKFAADQLVSVFTSDKDLFQLVTAGVNIVSPRTGEVLMTPQAVKEKLGVFPEQVQDFIALAGDAADGIPGAPKIGKIGAIKLLEEHGSLRAIMQAADEKRLDPKTASIISENRALIATCYVLATPVTDLPIEFDESVFERASEAAVIPGGAAEKMFESWEKPPKLLSEAEALLAGASVVRPNIHQRMREVMKLVPGVAKAAKHQQGYAYTGHEALTHALRPAYIKCGIVRTCSLVKSSWLGADYFCTVEVRLTNVDDKSDFVAVQADGVAPSIGKDKDSGEAKRAATQPGVGFSYAQKCAEFKAFCITGDDTPDGEEYE
jgi:5'-3' exonuclease